MANVQVKRNGGSFLRLLTFENEIAARSFFKDVEKLSCCAE